MEGGRHDVRFSPREMYMFSPMAINGSRWRPSMAAFAVSHNYYRRSSRKRRTDGTQWFRYKEVDFFTWVGAEYISNAQLT